MEGYEKQEHCVTAAEEYRRRGSGLSCSRLTQGTTLMQHERTYEALECSGLTLGEVFQHYLNMGGWMDEFEVDAYLHGLMQLSAQERDCVSQAVNELIHDMFAGERVTCCRAPYSPEHRTNLNPLTLKPLIPRFRLAN